MVPDVDAEAVGSLRAAGFSPVMARILALRGLSEPASARAFIEPDLPASWADPLLIPGMAEAAAEVAQAVRSGARIVVFGDFDLDGISAAALLARGLREMGADVAAMVPHRFREGYGLTAAGIERAMTFRPELLVTVDCGVSGAAEVELLRDRGVRVVVTDHHEPGGLVPIGVPVANPLLASDREASGPVLAGAGVALKLVDAVGREEGFPEVWSGLTDLATMGTIADMVPLVGENRALVAHGLRAMRRAPRTALAALAEVAGVDIGRIDSHQVAFALAPRLNAPGRMSDPEDSLALLLEDDAEKASELAVSLDEQNRIRQQVEADLHEAAELEAATRFRPGDRQLVLAGEGWHEGVKGIVASRLAARYGVPTILFCVEDGLAKGSGRSVGTLDMYSALASMDEMFVRFGGHAAAVGLTIESGRLVEFGHRWAEILALRPPDEFETPTLVDAEVELGALDRELATELTLLEPYGAGNPRPVLFARGVFMGQRKRVGRKLEHLRFAAFDGKSSVQAVAFRCPRIVEAEAFEGAADLAFQLDLDEWRGRERVQMIVRDLRLHGARPEGPAAELVEDLFARAEEIVAREEYAGIGDADAFHTKLAGVTFEGRQEVLAAVGEGTPLRLERQRDNPYDANAIAVFTPDGVQAGFLNRRLAAVLAPAMDAGAEYDVEASGATGGEDGRNLGMNVLVSRRAPEGEASAGAEMEERRRSLASLDEASLDAALLGHFIGAAAPHDAQADALRAAAAGASVLVVMATGRGKSLVFQVHAARTALRSGLASVFVYPLRALVADQAFHMEERFAGLGLSVSTVTGETVGGARDSAFAALSDGSLDVVLTTPEFLCHHVTRFAQAGRIGLLVVDEAHHVGLARAGRRPAYARLGEARAALGHPQVIATTATAGDDVARAICETLGVDEVVTDPSVRENLLLRDERGAKGGNDAKDARVAAIASSGRTIVYVNSREQSVRLARSLRSRVPALAWRTAFYNGGLTRSARAAVERAFRSGDIDVVVATSAFGEGVNIPDIRNVVLYHLPFNEVAFNQMCGRAGRDGAPADVHLLFGERDARLNELVMKSQAPERDDLAALYLVLRDAQSAVEGAFEVTNAELADRVRAKRPAASLNEGGVSAGLGVFRELGLLTGEGHGSYRRLALTPVDGKVELSASVRYAEARDEIEEFGRFKSWVLAAPAPELLARFNRPILPSTGN